MIPNPLCSLCHDTRSAMTTTAALFCVHCDDRCTKANCKRCRGTKAYLGVGPSSEKATP